MREPDRRIRVLLDPDRLTELRAESAATGRSVGSLIRDAVDTALDRRRPDAAAALERFFASGDETADPAVIPPSSVQGAGRRRLVADP